MEDKKECSSLKDHILHLIYKSSEKPDLSFFIESIQYFAHIPELMESLNKKFSSQGHRWPIVHFFVLMYPHYKVAEIMKMVLTVSGLSIDARDQQEDTPLHKAALWGFSEMVELLLDHNAGCNTGNIKNQTPLHLAASRGYTPEIKGELKNGRKNIPYSIFLKHPLPNKVTFTPNTKVRRGNKKAYESCMKLLLAKGAIAHTIDNYGNTPLHYAADQDYFKGLCIVLEHDASLVHAINCDGQTALHRLMRVGTIKSIKTLLDNGADSQAIDIHLLTPCAAAYKHKNIEAYNFLLQCKNMNNESLDAQHEEKNL